MYLIKLFFFFLVFLLAQGNGHVIDHESDLFDTELYERELIEERILTRSLFNCDCDSIEELQKPVKIKYHLFTRRNRERSQIIVPTDDNSIKSSNYNASHQTRFITHGWRGDSNSDVKKLLVNAFLSSGYFNVIFIDWSSCAKSWNYCKTARTCVPDVGRQVAEFIDILNQKFGLNTNQLTLAGHSLGAHVVGIAGKKVSDKINTIIGLDAAKPCFNSAKSDNRLSNSDAYYVETIHTNGGTLGFIKPIGDASFYPNWGKKQKACSSTPFASCSHSMSFKFYAQSIVANNFTAIKCESYEKLLNKDCYERTSVKMGGEPSNAKNPLPGIYYVDTNAANSIFNGTLLIAILQILINKL